MSDNYPQLSCFKRIYDNEIRRITEYSPLEVVIFNSHTARAFVYEVVKGVLLELDTHKEE